MRQPVKQFELGGQHRDTQISFGMGARGYRTYSCWLFLPLSGVGRFVAFELRLAFGILSKIYRQILVSFFKNGIVGRSRERHADLGLMPQIRTLRPHDTHRVQLASFQMLDGCGRCAGQILLRNVKNSAA